MQNAALTATAPAAPAQSLKLAAGLALAAGIAWLAPFDLAFDAGTFGQPALRAAAIVALALAGLAFGARIGLRLDAPEAKRRLLTPAAIATAVAVGCAAADVLMRQTLHPRYVEVMTSAPLNWRLGAYMLRAFNENILYRLFLGSALIWAIGRVWKGPDGRPATGAYWTGFALSQAANVWINVTSQGAITGFSLLHDALRYFAPGMVWSWLYWRRGFVSNEIASVGVHLIFQPLVTFWLAA